MNHTDYAYHLCLWLLMLISVYSIGFDVKAIISAELSSQRAEIEKIQKNTEIFGDPSLKEICTLE